MSTAETQTAPTAATESAPVLNFKLELEPSVSLETESAPATTEEIQPLDFSFSLDTPAPAAEKQPNLRLSLIFLALILQRLQLKRLLRLKHLD